MSKKRSAAPNISVKETHVNERLEIEHAFDARFPEFKHAWLSVDPDENQMKVWQVVRENDQPITNGLSVLCRRKREDHEAQYRRQAERSISAVEQIRNDDGRKFVDDSLRKFRNPKSPTSG